MTNNTRTIVKVIPATKRTWTTIAEIRLHFSEADVVEMVHRYQDTQDHAIRYRHNAQAKNKAMKARLAQLEAMMATNGQVQDEEEEEEVDGLEG